MDLLSLLPTLSHAELLKVRETADKLLHVYDKKARNNAILEARKLVEEFNIPYLKLFSGGRVIGYPKVASAPGPAPREDSAPVRPRLPTAHSAPMSDEHKEALYDEATAAANAAVAQFQAI